MNQSDQETAESTATSAGRLERVGDVLRRDGYAHLSRPHKYQEFADICAMLGDLESRTDLKIDGEMNRAILSRRSVAGSGQRPSVFTANEIGFHADTPEVDFIGWHCFHQDDDDGALLMVDLGDIESWFSPEELALLGRITVQWTTQENGAERAHRQPVIAREGGINKFYYAPWLLDHPEDESEKNVLEKFVGHLRMLEASRTIAVRLHEGESLFIDNRRMLHARHAISPESRRHIVRLRMRGR
ncbi:MAG: TauD/TfdA family dioxygenase [Candidatus Kapaibacterium sp.]